MPQTTRYDPDRAPDPAEWLELDEQLRIDAVAAYHRAAGIEVPDGQLHALTHEIVENQLAEAHAPVVRALRRLMQDGLSRHDAVHAIGSVLAEHMFNLLRDTDAPHPTMTDYDAEVERLTAASWMRKYGNP